MLRQRGRCGGGGEIYNLTELDSDFIAKRSEATNLDDGSPILS